MAAGRGDAGDDDGPEPGVPDGVPQGRRCSPAEQFDLSPLRQIGAAGSPLPPEGFDWIYEQLGPDVLLNNGSGGTDVCTGNRPGRAAPARLPGRDRRAACLAVDVRRLRPRRQARSIGELGELVIRSPMPSMPVGFWNDPGRPALPRRLLRALPGRVAPRRLDHVHRARQLRDHRPLRRDAEPRRRPARDRRAVRGRRGASRRSPTASSCTSRTPTAARAS